MRHLILRLKPLLNIVRFATFIFAIGAFPIGFATFVFAIHNIFLPENENFVDSEAQNCALLKHFMSHHIFLNFVTLSFMILPYRNILRYYRFGFFSQNSQNYLCKIY